MDIKEIRKNNNISQEKMAEILGVSRPTVVKIEEGIRVLGVEERHSLERFLGLPQSNVVVDGRLFEFIRSYDNISLLKLGELLETLNDYKFLNKDGQDFYSLFWKTFIKEI